MRERLADRLSEDSIIGVVIDQSALVRHNTTYVLRFTGSFGNRCGKNKHPLVIRVRLRVCLTGGGTPGSRLNVTAIASTAALQNKPKYEQTNINKRKDDR
jgi:hypothetical protein